MKRFLPVMWTVTGALLLALTQTSRATDCHITPYPTPAQDQARLDRGSVGEWHSGFDQQMIQISDIDGNRWDYFSLQKRPEHPQEAPRLLLFLHGFPEFAWAWEKELAHFGDQ